MRKFNLFCLKFCFVFSALLFSSGILHAHAEEVDPLKYIDQSYIDQRDRTVEIQGGIENIVSKVNPNWSDEEKALFVHDYLIESAQYDYDAYESGYKGHEQAFSAYGIIVLKTGVCSGYADAYAKIMNRLGIECKGVSSEILNHAWNIIKINGKWYYVDCTWDDPGKGDNGTCLHWDFLVSRDELYKGGHKSTDWMCEGEHIYANDKTSKDHDNWYWKNVDKPITYVSGGWMYQKSDGVYIHQYPSNTDTKVSSFAGLDMSGNAWAFSYGDYQLVANKYNVIVRDRSGSTVRSFSVTKEVGSSAYIETINRKNGNINLCIRKSSGITPYTLDWTDLLEEKLADSTLPTGQTNAFIGGYMVSADKDRIYLMNEYGNLEETFYLESSIKDTRYIHDIVVVNGVVSYTTWLRTPTGGGSDTQTRKPVTYTYNGWSKYNGGSCGDNVTWSVVDGKLTISGFGKMTASTGSLDIPWHHFQSFITEVLIEEGVTYIPHLAFYEMPNLKKMHIPSTIEKCEWDMVWNCQGLSDVYYNGTMTEWDKLSSNLYANSGLFKAEIHFAKTDPAPTKPISLDDEHPYGNVSWRLDGYRLVISGKGDMPEENRCEDVPWYEYMGNFSRIEIEEGITSISNYVSFGAGKGCIICIPESVTKIQPEAFQKDAPNNVLFYSGAMVDLQKIIGAENWKYYCNNCSCEKIRVDYIIDNEVQKTESYVKGCIPEELEVAQREGYTFDGWFMLLRGDYLERYSFDAPLNYDTCLYAKWSPVNASESENTDTYSEQGGYQYDEGYESTYSYEYVPSSTYDVPSETTSGKSKTSTGSADDSDMQEEDEIHEIPANAYKNRTNLKSFTIGAEIEKIGSSAFSGCKNLKKITIKAKNLKSIGRNSFKGIKKGAKITIICKDKKTFNKLVKQIKKAGAKKAIFKFKKG